MGGTQDHDYRTCRDQDCERYICRIYQEGLRNGQEDGYARGYAEGVPDGMESCPLPHKG